MRSEHKIKDLGEAKQRLGVRIKKDNDKGCITLDQEAHVHQLSIRFNKVDCKNVNSPINNFSFDDNDKRSVQGKNFPYQKIDW